jgi:putative Mn2+ efflux pump MntP
MAVATSIDALVVGLSFAFVDIPIVISAIVIGSVTAIVAMLGILFGKKAGVRFGKKMEILGGIILIGIGAKILIEHLFFT